MSRWQRYGGGESADHHVRSGRGPLSHRTRSARTLARTGLSPQGVSRCGLLQYQFRPFAATFRSTRLVTYRQAGLLIPRPQVRILPGPLRFAGILSIARAEHVRVCVRARVHERTNRAGSLPPARHLHAYRFSSLQLVQGDSASHCAAAYDDRLEVEPRPKAWSSTLAAENICTYLVLPPT
jgi:hypothetical protein